VQTGAVECWTRYCMYQCMQQNEGQMTTDAAVKSSALCDAVCGDTGVTYLKTLALIN